MVDDWITISGFLDNGQSKKGKVLTLFEEKTGIQKRVFKEDQYSLTLGNPR